MSREEVFSTATRLFANRWTTSRQKASIRRYNRAPVSVRLNSLLLVCLAVVGSIFAQAPQEATPGPDIGDRVITDRLKSLSSELGGQPTDCVEAFAKFGSVDNCAHDRLEHGQPFYLSYSGPVNLRYHFSYGLAADAAGNVFSVTYHERGFPPVVLNKHMRLMDQNHTRVAECIKPIKLDSTNGWLTCPTPVNEQASATAAKQEPIDTTVCAVLADPDAFNNKLVRIRAYYVGDMENSALSDDRCNDGFIWLGFPGGGVPTPVAAYVSSSNTLGSEDAEGKRILPIPVSLLQDAKFERFQKLIRVNPPQSVPLAGEKLQHVTATFVGRIDAVSPEVHEFFKSCHSPLRGPTLGFGHLGGYEAELILQSVADDATVE